MVQFSYKYLEDLWTEGYWKFICDNSDKELDWSTLSENPNITWEIIQNNLYKSWCVSNNPNITWEIIKK